MSRSHVFNHIDYIEFPVADADKLAKTETFFSTVFGWAYKNWGEDYSDTVDSGVGSGLNADSAHRPEYPLVVIYCEDLIAARDKVIAAGGTVTRDIFAFPGGQRFHFLEPGGIELAVWSD